ncbi:MAG: amino-acid N-acetyltransferase [Gammaproteobacteria bacterium]|nr:amino-acid N-acetyltransferase [Gammaproteobacteria bacterium]
MTLNFGQILADQGGNFRPMTHDTQIVDALREASGYIHALRDSVLVVHLQAHRLDDDVGQRTIQDLVRLKQFGARIILVHGIKQALNQAVGDHTLLNGQRVSNDDILDHASNIENRAMQRVESIVSVSSSRHSLGRCSVVAGNWVTARPLGVIDGVDHLKTGVVRSIDKHALLSITEAGHIVQVGPVQYSITGDRYNIRTDDMAMEIAVAVGADKLVYLNETPNAERSTALSPATAEAMAKTTPSLAHQLQLAARAVRRGVGRVHLVSADDDGGLFNELLTRDGVGRLVSADRYEGLRKATLDDVGGIVNLIEPLEAAGQLVPRGRQAIEIDIDHYWIFERDGMVIACAALLPIGEKAYEIACVATHENYRGLGRAAALLEHLIEQTDGEDQVFALSTQTSSWFNEHGFVNCDPRTLPAERLARYDPKRGSKVLLLKRG